MKQQFIIFFILVNSIPLFAQDFAPAPNQIGSTAIHKDSSIFSVWANTIDLQRGYVNIADKSLGLVTFGVTQNGLGKAEGTNLDVVSLGDSGIAILQFAFPIYDGIGYDFAVFENAFADHLLELAFVEVSSDGNYFARFPAISEIPLSTQLTGFEYSDCRYVNNLAGKYRAGFGTPFDLSEIQDPLVDVSNITHIKLIDVIGDISGQFSNQDQFGTIINDPFPTPFESSGFDLDGIGVIHAKNEASLKIISDNTFKIYPNPCINELFISGLDFSENKIELFNIIGERQNFNFTKNPISIDCSELKNGLYYVQFKENLFQRFIKE